MSYQSFTNFNYSRYRIIIVITIFSLCVNFFVFAFILLRFLVLENESQNNCSNINADTSPLNSGLVLYFRFNKEEQYGENRRIVCDFSGSGNNGRIYGTTWNSKGGELRDGAFEFDGINDRIIVRDEDSLSPSTFGQNFTVSFWVKFDKTEFVGEGSQKNYINFIRKGSVDDGYEWVFRHYNSSNGEGRNDRVSFYAFNQEGGLGAGSYFQERIENGGWIYITGVINGTYIKIYKNGLLQKSTPLSSYNISMKNGESDIYIGKSEENNYFKGSIDELRIYNKPLNDSQVGQIYNLSIGGRKK